MSHNISIPLFFSEWIVGTKYFTWKKFPIVISWEFVIDKYKGEKLYVDVNYIGKSERCCETIFFVTYIY